MNSDVVGGLLLGLACALAGAFIALLWVYVQADRDVPPDSGWSDDPPPAAPPPYAPSIPTIRLDDFVVGDDIRSPNVSRN